MYSFNSEEKRASGIHGDKSIIISFTIVSATLFRCTHTQSDSSWKLLPLRNMALGLKTSRQSKLNATTKVVPLQRVFRIKRIPDGKSRSKIRRDLQEYTGVMFSPVASWSTVRSFLVISAVLIRITCTIDF